MPKIVFLPNAGRNLVKLKEFLEEHSKEAAGRDARLILDAADGLKKHPLLGRPCDDLPEHRDLVIPFGAGGYVLRYRIEGDTIYIVAVKHTNEAGF